jgi:hypothetical protein
LNIKISLSSDEAKKMIRPKGLIIFFII